MSEDLIKRAKQMDFEVKYGSSSKDSGSDLLIQYIQVLETKINILSDKIDRLMETNSKPANDTHEKIMNMMWDWRSSSDLAGLMGYSQEHVSRVISEMKKRGIIQERRDGKKIFYKRNE